MTHHIHFEAVATRPAAPAARERPGPVNHHMIFLYHL
jgi:hypothetical protein